MLLPTLLTDLLFAGKERDAEIFLEEKNPAMAELLTEYGRVILKKAGLGGKIVAGKDRASVLDGADCVLYAGDPQAGSRFFMDRAALESGNEQDPEDPGLTDQARVNGGIEGLLHAMRAGQAVLELCDAMDKHCPKTLVINMGQPVARTTEIFLRRGFDCYGVGRSPVKGPNGIDAIVRATNAKIPMECLEWRIAGLPGFSFLIRLRDRGFTRYSLMGNVREAVREEELGRLTKRWMGWWDAVAIGDVTDHAEFLQAQPDYIPREKPEFGETVERRKERILYMNTVRNQGADGGEGAMAQLLLLSKAPAERPVQLALTLLRKQDGAFDGVTSRNAGDRPAGAVEKDGQVVRDEDGNPVRVIMPLMGKAAGIPEGIGRGRMMAQLPEEAVVETSLKIEGGKPVPREFTVPPALAETMKEIDSANRLAARAAMGDRNALREYAETDPALGGLDRLYCLDVIYRLIALHQDLLPLWAD